MQNDSELLRLYADGTSHDAFAELVRRHIGPVYAVALRRVGGDAHLADDVTQEVFTDLARKAGSIAPRETLVGWLFVAARYSAAKAVRRDRQRQSLEQRAQTMMGHGHPQEGEPDWETIRPVLDEEVSRLGRHDRDAVLLYFFEMKTYAGVGARLSLSESGARMRVERALAKLRLSLGRRGIASTTAALTVAMGTQAVAAVPAGLAATATAAALAGSTSGGVVLLYLMSITKIQLGAALAIVVAGASLVAVGQHREIIRLRTENTSALNEAAANGRRVKQLAGRLADDEAALRAMKVQVATLKSAGGGAGTNGPASTVKVFHMKDIIREHPEYAALMRKDIRRNVVRQYLSAIGALNLSPDEAGKLKELLVERDLASFDAHEAEAEAGVADDSAGARKADSEATKESNLAITALIGSDANEKLEALKGTMNGSQNDVDDMALDLADAGHPISADQSQALAQWLHDLGNASKNPDAGTPGYRDIDPDTWQSPFDRQFFTNAATILSPEQLQILETTQSEKNHDHAIMKQYFGGGSPAMIVD
jgi:RNA polymerase sigma factor (sigma-70 family)